MLTTRFFRLLAAQAAIYLACMAPCSVGSVTGRVIPPDATVRLIGTTGEPSVSTRPDAKGRFGFYKVGTGTYEITASRQGYIFSRGPKPITVTEKSSSGGHLIKLVRGAMLRGHLTPHPAAAVVTVDNSCLTYDSSTGEYETDDGLPTGRYELTVRAGGYVPFAKTIDLIAGKTSVVDIHMERTGSISGKLSPAPLAGSVGAKNTASNVFEGYAGEISPDGSYKIDGLRAGTYDLSIMAKGYERVMGWGPSAGNNSLTEKEKAEIRNVFDGYDQAWAAKDADAVLAMLPSDAEEKDSIAKLVKSTVGYATTRRFDYIGGQSGKSAVVIMKIRRKLTTSYDGKQETKDEIYHARQELAFRSGTWRVESADTSVPTFYSQPFTEDYDVPRNVGGDYASFAIVAPMEGEPGFGSKDRSSVAWRYTADPRIVGIKVEAGVESKGHDFALIPLPQTNR